MHFKSGTGLVCHFKDHLVAPSCSTFNSVTRGAKPKLFKLLRETEHDMSHVVKSDAAVALEAFIFDDELS